MSSTATQIPDGIRQAIEQALKLRQAYQDGKELRFLAPCHDDHDPSARWNGDKAAWFCDVCKTGGGYTDLAQRLGVSITNSHGQPARRIVTTYDYRDEQGTLLYQVVRYEPKDFRQRRPDGKDGWIWSLKDVRRMCYRLPELSGQSSVLIVEGEKDADRLWSLSLPATCNAGGAGKWTDEHTQQVKALGVHEAIILSDNDDPGRQHAQTVARSCFMAGLAVKIVTLPNLPAKGDVSDWLDAGGTKDDLNALADAAPCWMPDAHDEEDQPELAPRLTDVGSAELFARQHREDVRYSFALKQWFVWDGQRWKPDTGGRVMMLAKQTARSLYNRAATEPEEHRRKALAKWAAESETERRLTSMVSLARSEPRIAIEADRLDADPLLLNVLNGTLDLRTGTLRTAHPGDFITKVAPVDYQPDAGCPEFDRLLTRLFEHVPAVREYLQRIFGYSLTGLTSEQCFFIFHGVGANGKSTILRAILDLLGDYATTTRPETFLAKRGDGIPNDVAALAGARFVVSLESEQGQRLAEALVKGITGGDKLSARFLHREFFTFAPQLKFFIGTNHKPTIKGTDHALWRRVRCILFAVVIPDHEQDKHLSEKLRAEFSGILNWLVQGCLAWQRDGLGPPLEVQAATQAYRAEQDVLGAFLKERCVLDSDAKITKKDIYAEYVVWCEESGERHRLSLREFGKVLRERGLADAKVNGGAGWIGLRLRTPFDDESGGDAPVAAQTEVVADEN